jgi:hypothetical protein
MSEHLENSPLGHKGKLKCSSLPDVIDMAPRKLQKTAVAEATIREEIHSDVIVIQDTTETATFRSCRGTDDLISPINDQKDLFPTVLPNFRRSSLAQRTRGLRARNSLCKRCKVIDLDKLLSTQWRTFNGFRAGYLKNKWEVNACALCDLFCSAISATRLEEYKEFKLRAFSSKRITYMGWNSIDTNMLQLWAFPLSRYIVSQPTGIQGPVQMIREKIERYEVVKEWIHLCQSMHTTVCMVHNPLTVRYQRLIDCQSRTLVPAEDHPYVALSYVWGHTSETCNNLEVIYDSGKLSEKLPRTIEDAITVTLKLDFRYLWIDRYCINQKTDNREKEHQIEKMDLIYMNAELTIIAAAGSDPDYGLPGVGDRRRKSRYLTKCSKIGKHFLMTTDFVPTLSIKGAKWNSRAWTFQEVLLSRRRLVFTKKQMYFECHGMYCCESLNFSLERMHRKDKQGFQKTYFQKGLVGAFPKGVGRTDLEIVYRIEEYTKRALTKSDDILKGMLGIFNAFERRKSSAREVKHYLGVPILAPMTESPSSGKLSKPVQGWTPAMGFVVGLCWNLWKRTERRSGFPS